MGYTHYFIFKESALRPNKNGLARLDEKKFKRAVTRCKKALEPYMNILAGTLGEGKPEFKSTFIGFNGIKPHDYESFYIDTATVGYNFCKTGREAYSPAVALALLIFKEEFGDDLEIRSDGTMYEDVGTYNDYLKREYTFDDIEDDWREAYKAYEEFTEKPYYGERITDKL